MAWCGTAYHESYDGVAEWLECIKRQDTECLACGIDLTGADPCPLCGRPVTTPSISRVFPGWQAERDGTERRIPEWLERPYVGAALTVPRRLREELLALWNLMPRDPNGTPRATASELLALASVTSGDFDRDTIADLSVLFSHLSQAQTRGRHEGMEHRRRVEKAQTND